MNLSHHKLRSLVLAGAIMALVALAVAGCGSDSSSSLTKAEMIKQGDAICKKADERQAANFKKYVAKKSQPGGKAGEEELIRTVGLPPLQEEVTELAELEAPSGDEVEVEAIIKAIEEGIEEGEEDPAAILETTAGSKFAEAEKLASAYGFKNCGKV